MSFRDPHGTPQPSGPWPPEGTGATPPAEPGPDDDPYAAFRKAAGSPPQGQAPARPTSLEDFASPRPAEQDFPLADPGFVRPEPDVSGPGERGRGPAERTGPAPADHGWSPIQPGGQDAERSWDPIRPGGRDDELSWDPIRPGGQDDERSWDLNRPGERDDEPAERSWDPIRRGGAEDQPAEHSWSPAEPGERTDEDDTGLTSYPSSGPEWDAGMAATSTAQAEWELAAGVKARGRRRAERSEPHKNRAGRNLPAAIGVGVGMVLVVLVSLVLWAPAFYAVLAVAAGFGVWEMSRALRVTGAHPPVVPLVAGGVVMIGLTAYAGTDGLTLGLLVTVLASVVWGLSDRAGELVRDLKASLLIAVYVPFLLSFGVLLFHPSDGDGKWRVLCTLLAVVFSDTGGYAVGVFFGKHRMAPLISPAKSWEGFAGSVGSAAVGSSILLYLLLDVPFWWGLVFGALISVVAVLGDLAESMLKRDLGIKDMSRLLPGHGGVMDRLDSIVFAVPVAFLLLSLIAPPG